MPVKNQSTKKPPATYDPVVMNKLLNEPEIKDLVEQMKPDTLNWYKELLVEEGVYEKYAKELEKSKGEK